MNNHITIAYPRGEVKELYREQFSSLDKNVRDDFQGKLIPGYVEKGSSLMLSPLIPTLQ